jgi:hypothetical protein
MDSVWYYVVNGAQVGPVSLAELKAAAASGKLAQSDLVWQEGTADWVTARTVAGLFSAPPPAPQQMPAVPPQPTYTLSPPPPPPPPPPAFAPSDPEPLPLDDVDTGRARSRPLRDDGGAPAPGMPEWVKLAQVFLLRASTTDPGRVKPEPAEDAALTRSGVMDATSRKLATWRRSMLFVAAVPCAFAALFGLIDVIAMEKADKEFYSVFGLFLFYVRALAVFALPVAAVLAALSYDQLSKSVGWVLVGGLIAFVAPIAIAFVPTEWLIETKTDGRETVATAELRRVGNGMRVGVEFYLLLVPTVFSLLPAVSRACIRLKLLLPESLVPGWGLVASTPLFVLLTLSTFVLLYHIAGNALLLLGLVCWVGAPLLYLLKFSLLTRPVTEPADRDALSKLSFVVLGTMLLGIMFLLIFLFTAKVGSVTILGFDEEKSAVRPWSLDLHKLWIEYLGRSLFLTVFFADLLLKVSLSVWREERAFAGSAQSSGFDRTMTGLTSAVLPRGTAPPP